MTAIAVMVLVTEAIRKTVSSSTGAPDSMSATPYPWNQVRAPPRITPTASPAAGSPLKTLMTAEFSSPSATGAALAAGLDSGSAPITPTLAHPAAGF